HYQARRDRAWRHIGGRCGAAPAAGPFHRGRRAGRGSRTLFREAIRHGHHRSRGMKTPLFERDPSDPLRKEMNPLVKLLLELGPLMVFFFANARGEWLAERFPALGGLGGPLFVATAL